MSTLLWLLTKRNNCFLHTHKNGDNKVTLSSDPLNVMNLNRFKYAGLNSDKPVGGVFTADKKKFFLVKKTKKTNSPKRMVKRIGVYKKFSDAVKVVHTEFAENHYRPDLKKEVLARLCAMNLAARKVKNGWKSKKFAARPRRH